MRPEYLAEFEAPQDQAEPLRESRTRKVILSQPGLSNGSLLASNVAAILAGLVGVFVIAALIPMVFMFAIVRGFLKAERGRRRSGIW